MYGRKMQYTNQANTKNVRIYYTNDLKQFKTI